MELEFQMRRLGASGVSFETIVASGKRSSMPHGVATDKKVEIGDFITMDFGCVYQGYCSDITRTVAFGQINEEQREIYNTVLEAQIAAVEACRPGKTCAEIDLTARNIIRNKGYGDYFPHRLGHGLGISVHEYPSLTEINTLSLQEGMVFTIEPGIYVPGKAGVRIEDDLYVTENGVEILTKFPKELVTI
jgi:Xaa-Pro dipeptidase